MGNPVSARAEAPGAGVGIEESLIRAVVHAFYARVRTDGMLAPIFEAAIEDWPAHLDKLCAFWSSVTLMTGVYKGQPLEKHMRLPGLDDAHFRRWLSLFSETLEQLCTPEQAELFLSRAHRIADRFRFGIAMSQGRIADPLHARAPR